MDKKQFMTMLKGAEKKLNERGPEIAITIGVIGLITAGVEGVRVTPKAMRLIEEKKKELDAESLTPKETVETVWKCYILPIALGTASVVCIATASNENWKRKAALGAAYTISETKFTDYRNKVIDILGNEQDEEIKKSVANDKLQSNPVQNVMLVDGTGDTKCFDVLSGRPFKSSKETIQKVVNRLNEDILSGSTISLNDFYYELGMDPIDARIGDRIGWVLERGLISVEYSSLLDAAGNPCLVLDYIVAPTYDYERY